MTPHLLAGGVLLVAALLMAACSRAPEDEVVATVRAYTDALAIANEEIDLKPVESLVTEQQLEELRNFHHYLMMDDSTMVSTLEEFTVESAVVEGERGTVETSERWNFIVLDEAGRQKEPPRGIQYRNRYYLLREDDTWRIAEVQAEVR